MFLICFGLKFCFLVPAPLQNISQPWRAVTSSCTQCGASCGNLLFQPPPFLVLPYGQGFLCLISEKKAKQKAVPLHCFLVKKGAADCMLTQTTKLEVPVSAARGGVLHGQDEPSPVICWAWRRGNMVLDPLRCGCPDCSFSHLCHRQVLAFTPALRLHGGLLPGGGTEVRERGGRDGDGHGISVSRREAS